MKLDPLLLFSGNDIPFTSSGVTIHHPTIKEIAYLGEDTFFTGYQMLIISKNILSLHLLHENAYLMYHSIYQLSTNFYKKQVFFPDRCYPVVLYTG